MIILLKIWEEKLVLIKYYMIKHLVFANNPQYNEHKNRSFLNDLQIFFDKKSNATDIYTVLITLNQQFSDELY